MSSSVRSAAWTALLVAGAVASHACASRGDPSAQDTATSPSAAPRSAGESRTVAPPRWSCSASTRPTPIVLGDHSGVACTDERGRKQGAFSVWYPDGTLAITGNYVDDELAGAWSKRAPSGKTIELGSYAAGKKHGRWQRYADTGGELGDFTLEHGTGTERAWYADGQLASEHQLRDGELHGESKYYGDGGVVLYEARFTNGQLDGPRRLGGGNALRLEDEWRAGQPMGTRRVWRRSTLEFEQSFDEDGAPHGPFAAWRDRRTPREQGNYQHGRRHGLWRWTGRDGKLEREGSYVEGLRHGPWREWVGGVLVLQGRYVRGKPHGTFRFFNERGAELGRCRLRLGTGVYTTFHENRKPASRTTLVDGEREGPYRELSMRGQVLVQGSYRAGRRHGPWLERDPNGKRVREATYVDGVLDGVVRRYVADRLASETTFARGVRQGPYREWRAGAGAEPVLTVEGQYEADRKTGAWISRDGKGGELTAHFADGRLEGRWSERSAATELDGQHRNGSRAGTWSWRPRGAPERTIEYGPTTGRE